ncbi:GC-rich sequence DNA-binding factor 2 [Xenopus tropicalis]|uniref:GC-rich sequence DNA-binding factor 2 n=1 Tax=Xenopus tropicalis TaxID=8364 RepID=A0A6I8PJ73_XENTR|nr:GC-rich sequence DNA-binding factor 2 [Xenopus tropicalis]|eukprot:XP_002936033.2 PREDICTED: GC-rich sequence DNA-binding factor 2 [Xenopus tropicalis]
MFRKPKRAIRVRKAESSEEEEREEESEQPRAREQRRPAGRGLFCGTERGKRAEAAQGDGAGSDAARRDGAGSDAARRDGAGSDAARRDGAGSDAEGEPDPSETVGTAPVEPEFSIRFTAPPTLLSFAEEREDADFKIKKPSVNAVVFQVQKKTEKNSIIKSYKKERAAKTESDSDSEVEGLEEDGAKSKSDSSSELEDQREDGAKSESNSSSEVENKDPQPQERSDSPNSGMGSSPTSPDSGITGAIPGAKVIRAARRRRRLARAQGDYIPIGTKQEMSSSSQSESDSDIDDHERRIKFAPGTKTLREQMEEEMSSNSDSEMHKSEDEEDLQDKWEEQQIRKAVKYQKGMDEDLPQVRIPPKSKKSVEPRISLPPVTAEDIKKKLASRLNSFHEVHRAHVAEREKYVSDLDSAKTTLEKLEMSSSEQTYKFFKEMKTYVENFVDCVNEKIAQINRLELEMIEIFQKRAESLNKRRQDDLRNESVAVQNISGTKDANGQTTDLMTDCELRRKKRRQKRKECGDSDHYEGMSSDDELSTDDERSFQKNRESIRAQSKTIFEDVHEDFHQIKNILSRFTEWRGRFPESYYDAYISLCLHKLLNPIIRVHLLDWNPLEDKKDLEEMTWYQDLEEFCYRENELEMNDENSDHKVLSAVIEKTVIPKVSGFVELLWDPLSAVQTDNLAHFCKTNVKHNESSKAVQGLINCLLSTMKKAIEDDVFIPLFPKRLLEDRFSPHSRFQERRFWSAVKMFQNVLCWDGFLQEETLQELSLDKLLNRYLLLVILNAEPGPDSVKKCKRVVECLPQSWFRNLESGSSLHRLLNFSKHLLQSIHTLHKLNDRENMKILVSLLLKIKAVDYAEEAISQYNLEELKVVT